MAGVLHKLFRKSSHPGFITCINHQKPLNLVIPPIIHQPHIGGTNFEDEHSVNPCSDSSNNEKFAQFNGFRISPSFSFGYFLNPVSPSGFGQSHLMESEGLESDESRMVWADSVKKKRKRKMNKHKLKKLRKRLRHCS